MDAEKLAPGHRYSRHDRDACPFTLGQPFAIWEEQLESQVAKDAMDPFPLAFEHDDKENETANTGHEQHNEEALGRIAVLPVSQYRRSEQEASRPQYSPYLSDALYGSDADWYVYGLDGAHKQETLDASGGPEVEMMYLLATGTRHRKKEKALVPREG